MYSVSGYGSMIGDRGRMEAYTQALKQSVTPDSVVLDIGTGTGIFALLACQLGAKKVYAIETNPAIEIGKQAAVANGYRDKIEFIQDLSTNVKLPELADVIISDLRGVLPLFQQHIGSLADARTRLLRPGGVLIPQQDNIWVSVVEAPNLWNTINDPWDKYCYSFNMDAAKKNVNNIWGKGWVMPSQLLVQPQLWATLDYRTIENPNVGNQMIFEPSRSGTAHGLSVWFDATLIEGVGFSTAPGMPELIYGTAFFPFLEPVEIRLGDTISVNSQANLVNNSYIFRWDTQVWEQGKESQCKAQFKQSTFFAQSLSPQQLRKQAGNFIPQLNQEGKIAQLVLESMGQGKSVSEIAGVLMEQFPGAFSTPKEALTRVGQLSTVYSE
ncbi:MAG: 50S ribosomal protein L11 methyltransferase [Roseofilum sp. SBFL]|uniref:50S ribosomal protein L11 methyltransferase n=1 Tax=unclassified Roseofilum TaxID=2620099 RepID=UPI001AFCF436|nr:MULTISPECIES: 50S ribosomal protein L11 methyltransferase [unclassified Roseofilum]MBP0038257.1 50S ribosomal protein L11 methyltransferase [Roseofilum sp. SID1]MBP0044310.1 50S ribosomal protein L11 methyltransferase [Roseofilum sp. SBFL]